MELKGPVFGACCCPPDIPPPPPHSLSSPSAPMRGKRYLYRVTTGMPLVSVPSDSTSTADWFERALHVGPCTLINCIQYSTLLQCTAVHMLGVIQCTAYVALQDSTLVGTTLYCISCHQCQSHSRFIFDLFPTKMYKRRTSVSSQMQRSLIVLPSRLLPAPVWGADVRG